MNRQKSTATHTVREALETKSVELPTDVRLQYVEQGDPAGIPLLLLPGGFDSWRAYELVLRHLPASIHAFALTQRGHGDSSKPDTGYGVRDLAADAAAFMDALGLTAAVIVGASSSSLIAQRFAIDHPTRTLGLVFIGGFATMRDKPVALEVHEVASTLTDPVDPDFVRGFQAGMVVQPVPQPFLDTMIQEALKVPAHVWRAIAAGVLAYDPSGELNTIKAPTLIIWGDQDGASPRSEQETLAAATADSRLVVYPGAGHPLHWEEPKRVADELIQFLTDVTHAGVNDDRKRDR